MEKLKGLENNILVYRIVNDIIFSKLINKIDPVLKNPFDKDVHKINSKAMIKIVLFGIALIAANCLFFFKVKKPNLFEVMELPRICTETQVEQAFQVQLKILKQNSKGIFERQAHIKELQLVEIKDILKNPARRQIYDKFDITDNQYAFFLTPSFTMQRILQTGLSFLILLIASLVNAKNQEKSIIKWQVLLIINFFLLEVYLIQADSSTEDNLDRIFPALTISTRIHIIKFLLVPVSIIVGYITQKLYPNKTIDMVKKLSFIKVVYYDQLQQVRKQILDAPIQPNIEEQQKIEIEKVKQLSQSLTENQSKSLQESITVLMAKEGGKFDIGSIITVVLYAYIIYETVK